jgi:hypothetical protein
MTRRIINTIRSSKRMLIKILPFFLLVSLLPFLRSCGNLSYGFPLPAVYTKTFFAVESASLFNFLVNSITALILSALFFLFLLRFKKYRPVRYAIISILIYHFLYLFGYFIVYPLSIALHLEIIQYYYFLLYPFNALLSGVSITSDDSIIRYLYVLSVILWAVAGFLLGTFIRAKRS